MVSSVGHHASLLQSAKEPTPASNQFRGLRGCFNTGDSNQMMGIREVFQYGREAPRSACRLFPAVPARVWGAGGAVNSLEFGVYGFIFRV